MGTHKSVSPKKFKVRLENERSERREQGVTGSQIDSVLGRSKKRKKEGRTKGTKPRRKVISRKNKEKLSFEDREETSKTVSEKCGVILGL